MAAGGGGGGGFQWVKDVKKCQLKAAKPRPNVATDRLNGLGQIIMAQGNFIYNMGEIIYLIREVQRQIDKLKTLFK